MQHQDDGRPQGVPPVNSTFPVPTLYGQNQHRGIVGTGVEWMWAVAPCGRPSSSTLYCNGMAFVGIRFSNTSTRLMFRLISYEWAWEAAATIFMIYWLIPCYRPFYAKLV